MDNVQLAAVFGVTKLTVWNWSHGKRMTERHQRQLQFSGRKDGLGDIMPMRVIRVLDCPIDEHRPQLRGSSER